MPKVERVETVQNDCANFSAKFKKSLKPRKFEKVSDVPLSAPATLASNLNLSIEAGLNRVVTIPGFEKELRREECLRLFRTIIEYLWL